MNDKPKHDPRGSTIEWEIVEDRAATEPIQQPVHGSLQRTMQRLSQAFRRAPDLNDPAVRARTAAMEILEEADAVMDDLFARYRSRLNMADARDTPVQFERPTFTSTAYIEPVGPVSHTAAAPTMTVPDEALEEDAEEEVISARSLDAEQSGSDGEPDVRHEVPVDDDALNSRKDYGHD